MCKWDIDFECRLVEYLESISNIKDIDEVLLYELETEEMDKYMQIWLWQTMLSDNKYEMLVELAEQTDLIITKYENIRQDLREAYRYA